MKHYQPFLDHVSTLEYKTMKIGDGLERPEDITRSHFKNVTDYVEVNILNSLKNSLIQQLQTNLEEDLRISLKNINYLRDTISRIDETTREELSAVTKEIGNKIIFLYDNLATSINDQRCINLHLQMEIANMTKEKNTLRHDIKNLTIGVKKLETQLGVDPDPKFDNLVNQNIFNQWRIIFFEQPHIRSFKQLFNYNFVFIKLLNY